MVFGFRYWVTLAMVSLGCAVFFYMFFSKWKGNKNSFKNRIAESLALVSLASLQLDAYLATGDTSKSQHFVDAYKISFNSKITFDIVVKTLSKRIAFLTVCAFFMMNINIFFAGLTSTLTVDLVENPIESLDDLLAKRAKYQIVTYAGY